MRSSSHVRVRGLDDGGNFTLRTFQALFVRDRRLFRSERRHWIRFGRAPRRDIAGGDSHQRQKKREDREGRGISRADPIEETRYQP